MCNVFNFSSLLTFKSPRLLTRWGRKEWCGFCSEDGGLTMMNWEATDGKIMFRRCWLDGKDVFKGHVSASIAAITILAFISRCFSSSVLLPTSSCCRSIIVISESLESPVVIVTASSAVRTFWWQASTILTPHVTSLSSAAVVTITAAMRAIMSSVLSLCARTSWLRIYTWIFIFN